MWSYPGKKAHDFRVGLLPTRILGLPYYRLIRSQRRNPGKPSLGPSLQQRGVKTSNSFPRSLPPGGRMKPAPSIRGGPGSGQRGVGQGLPTCSCDVGCRAHAQCPVFSSQHLVFAPGSSKVAVFLVFLYWVIHNLPQLFTHTVIFSPL